jgi:hypothetical protein
MSWMRWGQPKRKQDDRTVPVAIQPPEQQYRILIVTDTETYPVEPIPESKTAYWACQFAREGALLERDREPVLYIPARRIMEIKFEKIDG